ncbi:MAG TPA: plasmid replication/partition related protein [Ideonella sp.]|uniref:plasmid replication/partition related protein n=1 Tax=Ideonella sp. TaxID=1929293 RepID=UPI002CDACFF2|nr:plasmid replication/partition related protein [Ideonella sp.]HSI51330.1 plasmid replication/partition related protein [Ideonella sp.]
MDIVVNEELKAYIDPLTAEEHEALERSILAEGCRDALVLWGNVLVDGHNRYGICQQHGVPFQTVQNTRFQSLEDVHLWMIDQHLGRRSVSDFQRGVLALRKREIVANRRLRKQAEPAAEFRAPVGDERFVPPESLPTPKPADTLETREALAKAARLSSSQVVMIEKIQKQAAPELVAAVRAGTLSLSAAAAVASLPAEEQVAAAAAGKDELKQAAKRVRDAKRKMPVEVAVIPAAPAAPTLPADDTDNNVDSLRQRVAALTAENAALRQQVAELHSQLQYAAQGGDTSSPF